MSSPPWDYIAKLVCIGDSGCGKSSLTIRLCEGRFSAQHDVTIGVEFGSRIVPVGPPHSTPKPPQLASSQPAEHSGDSSADAPARKPEGLPTPRTTPKDKDQQDPPEQKHMKLSLWDTAGQETYKSVTRSYFRGASGALLVFDITRKQTFLHVTDWLNDLRQIAEPDIVVVLVGNKLDRASETPEGEEDDTAAASKSNGNPNRDDGKTGHRREVSRAEAEAWAKQNGVLHYVETSAKSGENVEAAFMNVAERIFENINAGKYDLNDRRSGVKGPGPGTAAARSVQLSNQKKAAAGGCC
ncbi:P-loop containing nucleoside triphosphate hydrolase protein [Microdochium trichocladiopsis]|uniref:P-loop containing nucleoside triphosphate hydrolase protein n=1 Tax=Microdochium trichocladiopsis TaxID=1682393 RepID=A0A9P9BW77_9PEZI|nr:P-loop containing nucleoside triphosphate hydrolase protein [Microdochium trichocladiopsis]KAH7040527.1 P-loop containing nucleoside triphosphate hydrolase protein [Microdochium trichocladiopsis]